MSSNLRLALLISGSGSTASAIVKATIDGTLKGIKPSCVIASNTKANIRGLIDLGVDKHCAQILSPKAFSSSEAFGEAIIKFCKKHGVDLIGQYGWLCKTPANVIEAYKGRMINQHPGPLDPARHLDFGGPGMYGKRVHCARLLFVSQTQRDFWTEATAQRVAINYDEGAVLRAERVEILPQELVSPDLGDNELRARVESLAARVLPVERKAQIDTLRDFAYGTVAELHREEPLVQPSEEAVLKAVKQKTIDLYH